MKQTAVIFVLLLSLTVAAQTPQKIGDFIESVSNNSDKRGKARTQQYFPEGRAFVCENGTNRFTRALYGSHSDWRLETSDRPAFAVVKKGHHRNVAFSAFVNGEEYPLDKTSFCKAYYDGGRRYYIVKDNGWGSGCIRVEAVAMPDAEVGLWKFAAEGFPGSVAFKAVLHNIAARKLSRNGDIGADKPGVLEPKPGEQPLQTLEFGSKSIVQYVAIEVDSLRLLTAAEGDAMMKKSSAYFRELSGRIEFNTPDPYINTLGQALSLAADGDWDGQTWLHGCIGWRMPLAGWRAAYLGDVLGWNDRAIRHFNAYAKSQVTAVDPVIPHPSQDPKMNMARAEKRWGTQMYSNGYICRNPERNDQMHHYDMNLNYVDELLWHFQYDADVDYMKQMWPVIQSHLAWEKRNYDPDGDHLYDAYCCIWASDALYYNGGAVTHSSAYNYRGNLLAARIAEIIGEDGSPYLREAEAILKAMNERLWNGDHWAEYSDLMGLRRKHESAAVWSVYTPIDCGACSPEQAYLATRYVDAVIPHIDVENTGLQTIATSNWLPYSWSINNVAAAEVMHTALSFFEAGRNESAYRLLKANIMDQMYYGASPGNFGQISYYDAARGECYRDFGDCIGISSRTLLQGLFGIVPDALHGRCVIRPGFPKEWDSCSVRTPYIYYRYKRMNDSVHIEVEQNFRQPLQIVVRMNTGNGRYVEIAGNSEKTQTINIKVPAYQNEELPAVTKPQERSAAALGLEEPAGGGKFTKVNIDKMFNSEVDDIFKNEYLSPRPKVTTLQIPKQGIGEWCHPALTADINDSVFRTLVSDDEFVVAGVPFRTLAEGKNIIYTSLWDNYPDAVSVALKGRGHSAYLLMAGSTNHMQSRIDNGIVVVGYSDGSSDTLALRNPDNWCPIEQDYYVDGKAFTVVEPRPYRVCLGNGLVSRNLGNAMNITDVYIRPLPGGAAQMLRMRINPGKKLKSLTLRTLSNDVVIGLMAITIQN